MSTQQPQAVPTPGRLVTGGEGAIRTVTFDSPAKRNAVSLSMWVSLHTTIAALERDESARVIILTGAGDRAFVSGADISEFASQRSSTEAIAHYEEVANRALVALQSCTKPTIAAIRGACVGGGIAIATACDFRLAADDAYFAVPAGKLGVGYSWVALKRLVETVGAVAAKRMLMTARRYAGVDARGMGLIDDIVPAAALDGEVRSLAGEIAENAPMTLSAVKRIIAEMARPPESFNARLCDEIVEACFTSADFQEGLKARMEKRKPRFAGR